MPTRQGSWNELHARYTLHRINHQEAYSDGAGVYTNNAESFFSRMRRGEIGHHHHVAGPYLIRFAQEAAWREDHRKEPNGFQVDRLVTLAMTAAERRFLRILAPGSDSGIGYFSTGANPALRRILFAFSNDRIGLSTTVLPVRGLSQPSTPGLIRLTSVHLASSRSLTISG